MNEWVDGGDVCGLVSSNAEIFVVRFVFCVIFSFTLLLCVNKIICHSLEKKKKEKKAYRPFTKKTNRLF